MDQKLEVVIIPVWDVERAKKFCAGLGWRPATYGGNDELELGL